VISHIFASESSLIAERSSEEERSACVYSDEISPFIDVATGGRAYATFLKDPYIDVKDKVHVHGGIAAHPAYRRFPKS
jgi:hypothetical protein